jgi:hypothetical protein
MGINISKIVEAWSIARNPTDKQKELAEKRWSICNVCPEKGEVMKDKEWSYYCKSCGCPLKKKIFANNNGECPLGKWNEVDMNYFNIKKEKTLM